MPTAQLRPLGFGEILDGAFTIYRRHFSTLFATALLPYLPVVAFWALMAALASGGEVLSLISVGAVAMLPYVILATVVLYGALMRQVSNAVTGGPVSLSDGYGRAFERFLPLLGAAIVTFFLITLGLIAFIVPGILLTLMFFAVGQTVIIEGEGPFSALGRSRELARGAWLRILGILFLATLIAALPAIAFGIVAGVLQAVTGTLWIGYAFQAANPFLQALTVPFTVGAYVLLYYDRRARTAAEPGLAGSGEPAPVR